MATSINGCAHFCREGTQCLYPHFVNDQDFRHPIECPLDPDLHDIADCPLAHVDRSFELHHRQNLSMVEECKKNMTCISMHCYKLHLSENIQCFSRDRLRYLLGSERRLKRISQIFQQGGLCTFDKDCFNLDCWYKHSVVHRFECPVEKVEESCTISEVCPFVHIGKGQFCENPGCKELDCRKIHTVESLARLSKEDCKKILAKIISSENREFIMQYIRHIGSGD